MMLPYNSKPSTEAFCNESMLFYSCVQNGYCNSEE